MSGFPALDVLIGVVLMMSVLSLAASTIVEGYAAATRRRAKELEAALERMLWSPASPGKAPEPHMKIGDTTVIQSLKTTPISLPLRNRSKELFPSYLSSSAFVDAVSELVQEGPVPDRLAGRVATVARATRGDTSAVRTAIERHYDEAMERVSGMYKRWSTVALFIAGLAIAVAGNVSVSRAASELWSDNSARQAVVAAATQVNADANAKGTGQPALDPSDLNSVSATVNSLEKDHLPVGWTDDAKAAWGLTFTWGRIGIVLGWLVTAALVTLGAPFWFDLLSKLIALRSSAKPKPAGAGAAAAPAGGGDGAPVGRLVVQVADGGTDAPAAAAPPVAGRTAEADEPEDRSKVTPEALFRRALG
jgi:hypothetical protein